MQETQEMQVQSLGREDPLEEGVATHSSPLQYSCLENPTDRGAWRAAVHRFAKSRTPLKWLSMQHIISMIIVIYKDVGDTVVILVICGSTTKLSTL